MSQMIVAQFRYVDDVLAVVKDLRAQGRDDFDVYTPFPSHEIEEAVFSGKPRSPVRYFTLAGGLTGCLGAFLMTTWMSMDYPLRVSAKPIVSIPAFVVIAFECTVLLAAIITLIAMFHFNRIPDVTFKPAYRKSFSNDTFGVSIAVPENEAPAWQEQMKKAGAYQVEVQYVR